VRRIEAWLCDLNGEMDSHTVQGALVEMFVSMLRHPNASWVRHLSPKALQSFPATTASTELEVGQ
jgi:hypothetical protein